MSPKSETEYIEFIKEIKFRAYYDVNYANLRLKLIHLFNYYSKLVKIYSKLGYYKIKLILYKTLLKFYKRGVKNG